MLVRQRNTFTAALAASAAAIGLVAVGAQQVPQPAPAARLLSQAVSAPAIDTGLATEVDARVNTKSAGHRVAAVAASWPYEPGKVIVRFRAGGTSGARQAVARAVGALEIHTPSYADFDVLRIDPAADAEAVAATLMEREDVEFAQAAYRVYPYFRPNDALYDRQWNFPAIGMEQALSLIHI